MRHPKALHGLTTFLNLVQDLRAVFLQFSTRLVVTDSGDRNEVLRSLVAALRVPSQPEDEIALEGPWHIPPAVAEAQDQILEELLRVRADWSQCCTALGRNISASARLRPHIQTTLRLLALDSLSRRCVI